MAAAVAVCHSIFGFAGSIRSFGWENAWFQSSMRARTNDNSDSEQATRKGNRTRDEITMSEESQQHGRTDICLREQDYNFNNST